jgi:hypothetical protein
MAFVNSRWLDRLWLFAVTIVVLIALKDQHTLSERNCQNLKALAGIERTFIQQQQQQTNDLLHSGFTFGIPKDQLGPLIAQSEKTQQAFLNAFDALTLSNC